jgi:cell division protein FtsL
MSATTAAPPSAKRAPAPRRRRFLLLWTLATVATVCAFLVHLALRGRTVSLGYELGRARAEQARLREVKRVLEVEAASYKTPERVEIVARTLLGMEPPLPERIVSLGAVAEPPEHPVAASEPPPAPVPGAPP